MRSCNGDGDQGIIHEQRDGDTCILNGTTPREKQANKQRKEKERKGRKFDATINDNVSNNLPAALPV